MRKTSASWVTEIYFEFYFSAGRQQYILNFEFYFSAGRQQWQWCRIFTLLDSTGSDSDNANILLQNDSSSKKFLQSALKTFIISGGSFT